MYDFNKKTYLTPHEIAKKLKINLLTVYSYIKKKKLSAIRIGSNYRIDCDDFEKFIEALAHVSYMCLGIEGNQVILATSLI